MDASRYTNRILHGDCVQLLKTLPTESVDLVLTDPPYFVRYRDRTGRTIANDANPDSVIGAFTDLYRVLRPNSFCISFYGWNSVDAFMRAWRRAGFQPVGHVVWKKDYASSTGFVRARHEQAYLLAKGRPVRPENPIDDVRDWKYTGNVRHPTEKDPSILEPLIRCFSNAGDVVLDPFAGSGSTLIAAVRTGRCYLGIELEHRYCDLIRNRLSDHQQDASRAHCGHVASPNGPDVRQLWEWLHARHHDDLANTVLGLMRTRVN